MKQDTTEYIKTLEKEAVLFAKYEPSVADVLSNFKFGPKPLDVYDLEGKLVNETLARSIRNLSNNAYNITRFKRKLEIV